MTTVLAPPRAAILAPLRDWLRTTSAGLACGTDTTISARAVYAGGLAKAAPARSIVISKVGVGSGYDVLEATLIQLDCRAELGAAAACESLAALVKADLLGVVPRTQLGSSTVRLHGASIEGEVALPEDDGTPRFVVTARVTTSVAAP